MALLVAGCRLTHPTAIEPLYLSADGRGFILAGSRQPFHPWGFNYDRGFKSRVLVDYWDAEWETVAKDFAEMKHLGANTVRIHLQFGRFMDGPAQPNEHSICQLVRLVQLAESNHLYLDLTGLGCYRKNDVPAWYSALDEKSRWAAQASFWSDAARCCSHSPVILCYDLMNEPVVPSGKRDSGELGGFNYVQFITLDQAGRSRIEIVRDWVSTLTNAIRKEDPRHFITVGLLPTAGLGGVGFAPAYLASQLDYLSVHVYPRQGQLAEELANLHRFEVGEPVVIEETFPLNCSPAELDDFIGRSHASVSGWLGFYWGETPEQLRASTSPVDVLTREWLQYFQRNRP